MVTAPICRGCSRPIILFRNSFQSIQPYNQTTRISRWLQPNCARTSRRTFAMKVAPPNKKTTTKPPLRKSPILTSGQGSANVTRTPKKIDIVSSLAKNLEVPQLSFAQKLASNSTPTTLYEAVTQKMFLFSSYMAGFSCIAGAAVNIIVNVYNVPEGVHFIVPNAFGAVGIVMVVIGTRYALMPSGAVRSIKVLPARSVKGPNSAAKTASAADIPIRLQIEIRRIVPFVFRRIEADPNDVVMSAPMFNNTTQTPLGQPLSNRESIFYNFRRGITGEGFAPITINGLKCKLDITSAYVLGEGRALDRIVRIENSPLLAHLASKKKGH
ncbi:hypothetical protein F4781DRAFT_395178 [Annulohypoxylon bovei var. microspora]|nr:hypothetical protein F4781DRAFT_395178 [Annulohypoxylon bovei var. microspora]